MSSECVEEPRSLLLEKTGPIIKCNGTFQNPFTSWEDPSCSTLFKFLREPMIYGIPEQEELDRTLPVHKPDFHKLHSPSKDKLQYVWIGHASVLYQTCGWNILSDPVWSARCSPFSFMGPKRYREPPLAISELPEIDVVVISHNHYDHLDLQSVRDLNQRFGNKLQWCVPSGLKSWFTSCGCETVTELSWWEDLKLGGDKSEEREPLEIICTPAQHWSLRNGCDRNKSLWSSWIMRTSKHNIWFSGDTGYCDAFEAIGEHYGPFDLAAIAIGAYCPRYFMAPQHIDPEQALRIHSDLKSKLSFGIHWGTFPMGSTEPYLEPKELIENLQDGTNKPFITVEHGAINTVD